MTNDDTLTQQDVVQKLRDTELVMLTTALPGGKLLSHPMSIQGVTDDADVWFFVSLSGGQAEVLRSGPEVNLAIAEAGSWLSVAGRAAFVEDRAVVDQLWSDSAEAYFPGGKDDPDLGLLRVSGDSAQFWGLPGGRVAGLAQIVKAKVAGERAPGGTGTTEL
ncbi:general stress protein [Brachybacterium ginsengisoli]|uniref:General stress protein n=1 Tax=Brachybacterium ginsengisoli TaxID=1331682 RepID=A0A291H0E2_9MICO|nr:pyridoxamine 5'-phosphate oxidase family protein [Brachybacterium ginsengisoli]ATG55939.1 general stress protein [Brachybacterium ginsengisoli]